MPDPETLSVGEMIDLVTVQSRVWPLIATSNIIFDQYHRRDAVRSASSGFVAFEKWVHARTAVMPRSRPHWSFGVKFAVA